MSKLRVANRAKRPSEVQRRALEEKMSIEWIWKPMAATMKEKSTDQIYWNPTLYNSNLTAATTKSAKTNPQQQGSVRRIKLISSRGKIEHPADDSIRQEIEEEDESTIKVRKKKLSSSRRRDTLKANKNIKKEMEESRITANEDNSSAYCHDNSEYNSRTVSESVPHKDELENQDNGESRIHDETIGKPQENKNDVSSQSMEKEPGSTVKVRNKKLSSSSRRPKATAEDSITEKMEEDHGSTVKIRKKKLSSSRRRDKLWAKNNNGVTVKEDESSNYCPNETENNSSIVDESLPDDEGETTNDNDSGIPEDSVEKLKENECVVSSKSIESCVDSEKEMSDIEKEIFLNNDLNHNPTVQSNTNKPKNLTRSPTVLKLMEKLSHLHILPGITQRTKKSKKKSNKNKKRPSVRIYQGDNRLSSKQINSSVTSNKKVSNEEETIITTEPLLSDVPSILHANSNQSESEESGIYDESARDSEDTLSNMENLRNAQLQMMLRILSQLYDEKCSHQDTELEHLRTRVLSQDKLMKQLVNFTVDLKSDLDKLKNNQEFSHKLYNNQRSDSISNKRAEIRKDPPRSPKSNVLVIKIGEINC
ncbi:unnamed protein product [Meganyctiphanes norvegica]|uniref:Uncharacterized protein n=1 Tax=Meganyctiphanes norvegica TaxID=48144 RepID=A0AAV2QSM0_MEGNR